MAKSKPRYGRGTGKPHKVDVQVGVRVRQRRVLLGMTQTDLANTMDLTFQQVQKYEKGINRISASRLYGLSQLFGVTVEYFFEDMPPDVASISPAKGRGEAKKQPSYEPDPMTTQETMRLVRSYYSIDDANVRKRVYEMIKTLGPDAGPLARPS
jgi:transcriptional regulator with XRE-family HTH domain